MLDRQKTFDTVMEHLRAQGRPAIYENRCRYRGPDGTSCAIGALIPDEAYDERMEGGPASALNIIKAVPGAEVEDGNFLQGLQEIHDRSAAWEDFITSVEEEAATFATRFNLTYTGPAA